MGWPSKKQPCSHAGKSWLERRLKGQPLQPCIAPRALRGHPSGRPRKASVQKHHGRTTKNTTHRTTKTPHHKHNHTTTTKTPPHHHNKKPPMGIEPMTSRLLSESDANWAKLSLLWRVKKPMSTLRIAKKRCGIEKRCPHHKNTTTTPPPKKHNHHDITKTQPQNHQSTTITKRQPHHHHKNTWPLPAPCQLLSCLERRLKRCQRDVQMQ